MLVNGGEQCVMPNLQQAIQNLYTTFARYPLNVYMDYCMCCVTGSEAALILDGDLHDLPHENLVRFAAKAATTWGDVNDYRHFLPRIFELMATERPLNIGTEAWRQACKLNELCWWAWPEGEQEAIEDFFLAWFRAALKSPQQNRIGHDAGDILKAAASIGDDLGPYLNSRAKAGPHGVEQLAHEVLNKEHSSWDDETAQERFQNWLREPSRRQQLQAVALPPELLARALASIDALSS